MRRWQPPGCQAFRPGPLQEDILGPHLPPGAQGMSLNLAAATKCEGCPSARRRRPGELPVRSQQSPGCGLNPLAAVALGKFLTVPGWI